jgi:hypothetical protein
MASATGCTGFSVGLNVIDTHRNRIPQVFGNDQILCGNVASTLRTESPNRDQEVTRDEPLLPINTAISRAEIVGVELL